MLHLGLALLMSISACAPSHHAPLGAALSPSYRLAPRRRLALALLIALSVAGCQTREIVQGEGRTLIFEDDFERAELGAQWRRGQGEGGPGQWRIEQGALIGSDLKNDPIWWVGQLPDQARVEFDATALSDQGDVKFEIFGDGSAHASGYVVIFGGWKNQLDVIARLDEHGEDRKAQPSIKAHKDRTYRIAAERLDDTLVWWVDGQEVMRYRDEAPLRGASHRGFSFNDWSAPVKFDNVKIYRLD